MNWWAAVHRWRDSAMTTLCCVWIMQSSWDKSQMFTFCSGTISPPPSFGVGDFASAQSTNFSLNKMVSLCSVSRPNTAQSGRPWPFLSATRPKTRRRDVKITLWAMRYQQSFNYIKLIELLWVWICRCSYEQVQECFYVLFVGIVNIL